MGHHPVEDSNRSDNTSINSVLEQHVSRRQILRGGATAADVVTLMNLVRREVWRQFSILLEPEILLIGDWSKGPGLIDPRD